MAKKPDWTQEEFEVIVNNSALSTEALAKRLPERSVESVQLIRNGINSFHTGKNTSMLSTLMLKYLEAHKNEVVCPICEVKF